MKIQYRSRVYEVDPSTLIKRANVFWAALDTSTRPDCKSVHYVQVPHMTDMVYGCEEPPTYYTVPENIYPQALWLGIANGILEQSKRKLDIRVAVATSELAAA